MSGDPEFTGDKQVAAAKPSLLKRVYLWAQRRLTKDHDGNLQLRRERRDFWMEKWSRADYSPPWIDRGALPEVVEAVESGWFASSGSVLDIGCGNGLATAWFARRGYEALGIDIAPAAIRHARKLNAGAPSEAEYLSLDISAHPPPNRQFKILLDQGCLHQIPPALAETFADNISSVAAPDARMLIFYKAFRDGANFGDEAEVQTHLRRVEKLYGKAFAIERYALTNLAGNCGDKPERSLPGLVFWLVKR